MDKQELRKIYREKRKLLSSTDRAAKSQAILKQLVDQFQFSGKTVSVFLPIDRFSEVITWPLLEMENVRFTLPVVPENGNLTHIIYEDKAQIKVTDWGIPEPKHGETIAPTEIDMVIVPLLVIDKNGNRIGYGKGFYDNFLSSCRKDCVFVGVSFYPPIDQIKPVEPHDIPLHYCITPEQVIEF